MGKKIKVGIIGAGAIGSVHADNYKNVADAEVIALCDILPDKLEEKAARHGIPLKYTDYKELLANKDIEAVSICVPNNMHAPIAIDALKAGKHVMLEKPMCLNAQLARDVVAAQRTGNDQQLHCDGAPSA